MGLRKDITLKTTHQFLSALFSEDIHAKRVYSLANATLGVISSASLAVNSIGQGLALARGRLPKHAIKQVDRPLSNPGIDVDELSKRWIAHAVGPRPKIVVALDWTDFDADNQATIMLSLVTNHGRSTPLVSRHGIQVNGHLSWRISSRNFGSQPAHFRRVLTLPLALLARTRPRAKRLTTAIFLAPWPVR